MANSIREIKIKDVVIIAKKAGLAIKKLYEGSIKYSYKSDGTPITEADRLANNIINIELSKLNKSVGLDIPILSEESNISDFSIRAKWDCFWLVDPLDGTRQFIKKTGEFTVNIALVCKGYPILGVINCPATGKNYWATKGGGAYKNGTQLPLKKNANKKNFVVAASRDQYSKKTQTYIDSIQTSLEKKIILMGSSLKLCRIAEGEIDLYPKFARTMEWDIAAGDIVLQESGGLLVKFGSNESLRYNKPNLANPNFIATSYYSLS